MKCIRDGQDPIEALAWLSPQDSDLVWRPCDDDCLLVVARHSLFGLDVTDRSTNQHPLFLSNKILITSSPVGIKTRTHNPPIDLGIPDNTRIFLQAVTRQEMITVV